MMQNWYNPETRTWDQVVPPASDAAAVGLFSGREKAVKVYKHLRGPAYGWNVQLACRSTWEHFRDEDAGRQSPISTEVADL
jgi:hypothetical protein